MPYNYITLTPLFCMLLLALSVSEAPVSYAEASSDKASEAPVSYAEAPDVIFRFRYKVHILNGFPDNSIPLNIHCFSVNDDLGEHTLWKGQEFRFEFKINPFGTQFICHFDWGNKHLVDVNVFISGVQTKTCKKTGNCFWQTQTDGLYFSNHLGDWQKYYSW